MGVGTSDRSGAKPRAEAHRRRRRYRTRRHPAGHCPRHLGGLKDSAGEYVDMLEETYDYVMETETDFTGNVKDTVGV